MSTHKQIILPIHMFLARSLISAAEITASRMIGTYVNYPTNRPSRICTPLSSFLRRRALSTTPDSDDHLSTTTLIDMMKVGEKISNDSADFGTIASVKSSDIQPERYKPMDRDEKMAYLKGLIVKQDKKDAALTSLSEEITSTIKRQTQLLEKEALSPNESRLLKVINKNLPDMRKERDRLVAEIVELKDELSALKNPKELVDSPLSAEVPVIRSFEQLLGSNFDANAQRNEEILKPSFMPLLPRQGLDDSIKGSWHLITSNIYHEQRKPILFIHSAPGCGKTYFLRELSRKQERDCSHIDITDKIDFVGISFNSNTPIDADRTYLNGLDSTCLDSLPVLARIYYCLFTSATTDWFDFTDCLQEYFKLSPENVKKIRNELSALIHRRFYKQGKKLVLLFDEISKVDFSANYKVGLNEKRISSRVMSYIGHQADRNKYFSMCLMSELNMNVIDTATETFTASGRQCQSVGNLAQLTESQVASLFRNEVSKLVLTRVAGGKPRLKDDKDILLQNLYFTTCGHPRTIDYFISEVSQLKTETTLQHCITQILNSENSSRIKSPAWDVIQSTFLAKKVRPRDVMPNSLRSYNVAIANGEIIASLSKGEEWFTPQVSEMMLHKWAHENKDNVNVSQDAPGTVQRQVAIELKKILNIRFNFTNVSLETVLSGREFILSRIYGSPSLRSNYCSISLRDLYPHARYDGSDTSSKDFKVDASKPLIHSSEKKSVPTVLNNIICTPTNPINAGYDFRIRFSLAENAGMFVDVYYQVKFSEDDSSTSLDSNTLRSSHEKCASFKAHPNSAGFIVVFMTWMNGEQQLKVPPGCLLLHKDSFKATVGPNFCNFIETLTKYPILIDRFDGI